MSDEQELIGKARALGEALARHPRIRAHLQAQRAVANDESAQKVLRDYEAQLQHIRKLEAEQKPVEVADKQRLAALQGELAGNDALKQLMRTQTDYVALMSRVNQAMDAPLSAAAQEEPSA